MVGRVTTNSLYVKLQGLVDDVTALTSEVRPNLKMTHTRVRIDSAPSVGAAPYNRRFK